MSSFGKLSLCALMLAGLVPARVAVAAAEIELRVAAQEETAPKYVSDGAGVSGFCVDLMNGLERIAPELRFVGGSRWMPVVRVLNDLYTGNQDAGCGLAHTPERDKRLIFVGPALQTIDFVLVARANDDVDIADWNDVRKLGSNAIVLGNRGLFAGGLLASIYGIQYDTGSATSAQNLQKLLLGRGRFFLLRAQGINEVLLQAGVVDRVRVLPAIMGRTELYFTLGKHLDDRTVERVRQALAQMQATGELERLRRRDYSRSTSGVSSRSCAVPNPAQNGNCESPKNRPATHPL